MRYAVDLLRGVFYGTSTVYAADASAVVLAPPYVNVLVLGGIFAGFLLVGTRLFVGSELNR